MKPNTRAVNCLLVPFLQRPNLPPQTEALAAEAIAAEVRSDVYSAERKTWPRERLMALLEDFDRIYETCKAALAEFSEREDFEVLNAKLLEIRDELRDCLRMVELGRLA